MKIISLFYPRRLLAALILVLSAGAVSLQAQPVLRSGDLVAVCGDSITEQRLYSLYIEQYLLLCQPADNLMAMQFGWSGERAPGFNARIESNVLPFGPSVATTCYGMNDGGYKAITPEVVETYRKAMTDIVKKLKAGGVREIIVGSPGVVDTKSYHVPGVSADVYNQTLAALRDSAREVASAEGVHFADVHAVMMAAMLKAKAAFGDDYVLAGDGVHPSGNGHLAMAYAFLKAMGVSGDIGTLTIDYTGNRAIGTAGHKVTSYKQGTMAVESTRYPYCFTGPADGKDTLAMSTLIPFNEDLNRFRLVVQRAPAQTTVTWGSASKTFTSAQLAAGINLAAEFPQNPFSEPFAVATKALQDQQLFEAIGIKNILNPLEHWRLAMPEGIQQYDALKKIIMDKSAANRTASRDAVKPVSYTITVSPAL